ncbi:MAG: ArsR family transcriptional regulator, partial [Gammaproteobacteria bacterium]
MARPTHRGDNIKQFLLKEIPGHPGEVVSLASQEFGITRQAISRYIRDLVDHGLIIAEGKTKQRKYKLAILEDLKLKFKLRDIQEDTIWREYIFPHLESYPENVVDIWHYGCTEMINNAIDHSNGENLYLFIEKDAVKVSMWIDDDGVGIFKKIKEACDL